MPGTEPSNNSWSKVGNTLYLIGKPLQCGFCTPGFLASATEILGSGRRYSRQELRELLSGNLCRCTGYEPIVEAVFECQR